MSILPDRAHVSSSSQEPQNSAPQATDDPVTRGLRESARRMVGIAVFSGVINLLMLSGSLYMLQVYDRVIPSRNIATLIGLSLMVLLAYLVQGYFDALRTRMLCRVATLFDVGMQESIHTALATLPLRGVSPVLLQQPLRDLDQVRAFMNANREEILANTFYRGLPKEAHYEISREFRDDMARAWGHGGMTSVDAFYHYYSWFTRDQDYFEANMAKLKTPVRVVWGEKDIYIRKEMGAEFAERNKIRLNILPRLGHYPHLQDPKQAVDEVRAAFGSQGALVPY